MYQFPQLGERDYVIGMVKGRSRKAYLGDQRISVDAVLTKQGRQCDGAAHPDDPVADWLPAAPG